jgi:aspyridone synthetase (hybrid polyketide synthase/nonribosomal peptide synthetase)
LILTSCIGMRIELEEISNALCTAAPQVIADAIVTVRGDPELLLAHVVFQHGKSLSQSELRQLVHDLPLPKYMHPSAIVPLEFLPRTNSGKADRRAIEYLPLPDIEQVSAAQDDLTMAEGELRLLWEEVLQIPAERGRLGPDSDFFMAGGNSLLLVQLKSTIQESMALDVPIRDMYSASTLRQMSARITHSKAAVPAQEIDWEEETRPDFSEISKSTKIEPRHISGPREVLLTGATSFLGSYILRVLLKDPTIKHVHAIAIDRSKQANLPTSLKLTAYPGTLYHPTLGLSALDLSKISSTIDFIMHAGAVGHCLNNYSSVRAPNYTSTRFLASLALKRGIPLHYLSSSRVALLSGQHAVAPISVAEQFPVNDGSEGFTVSKWASERFLEQLAARTGLEVCIHRACAPIGDRAPNEDALNALLLYSKRMRATPVFEGIEGFFDFEEVGTIAARIVAKTKIEDDEASSQRSSSSSSSTRFFHHSSGAKVPVDQLKGRMESLHGGSFEQLPAKEWIERSKALGIESLITSYLEAMVQKGKTIAFPFLGEGMGQETR